MIRLDTHLGHAVIFHDILTEDGWLIWYDSRISMFKIWNECVNFHVEGMNGWPEDNFDVVYPTLECCLTYVKGLT